MATVTIEALKVGDETDEIVNQLKWVVDGNPFYSAGAGRWRIELVGSDTGEQARDVIESELDALHDAAHWRENLRLIGHDVP